MSAPFPPLPECPSFPEFYWALHGREPFPWQSRLAERVSTDGWPCEIGVPTGLGKTSAIDIAVWSLAEQADREPSLRTVPTRVWYVVDRRLLVDAASDHASDLAEQLVKAGPSTGSVLGRIAARLSALRVGGVASESPLHVGRLRGGIAGSRVRDPAQPAVLCSTVAMFGSRLLFRGFGVSARLAPIDAAHAGIDSLVLLDEAHLAPALVRLMDQLELCDANHFGVYRLQGRFVRGAGPGRLLEGPRARPTLVSLTATGSQRPDRFDLDQLDLANPVVARRLAASKPTRLVEARAAADIPKSLAAETASELARIRRHAAAVVFTNSPRTAREISEALPERLAAVGITGAEVLVLTGQMREPDAAALRHRLLDPDDGVPSGAPRSRRHALVVVATQTLEVGADLDFDICVSETAGVRAVVQRFGRLNRLGDITDASGILVHAPGLPSALYGDEPDRLWERLQANQGLSGTALDFGPARIGELVGTPDDGSERFPELLGHHLWEFAKTTTRPESAAPPELFFSGFSDPDLTVSVSWRFSGCIAGQSLDPPLADAESVGVGIGEITAMESEFAEKLKSNPQLWWRVNHTSGELETVEVSQIRVGDQLVLNSTLGCYSPLRGFDPDITEPVRDLSPLVRQRFALDPALLVHLSGSDLDPGLAEAIGSILEPTGDDLLNWSADPARDRSVCELALKWLASLKPEWCDRYRRSDGTPLWRWSGGLLVERVGGARAPVVEVRESGVERTVAIDALDSLSNLPDAELGAHLDSVGELAGRLARSVGLPKRCADAVELAGRFHDLGKADPRFQARLRNFDGSRFMAKSGIPSREWAAADRVAGWPVGGSHELLGVQMLDAAIAAGLKIPDEDLVRHLVISHHGAGRPIVKPIERVAELRTEFCYGGTTFVALTDPSRVDWEQPERFRLLNERFGYWGLALMEALVRQADHRVSKLTEVL